LTPSSIFTVAISPISMWSRITSYCKHPGFSFSPISDSRGIWRNDLHGVVSERQVIRRLSFSRITPTQSKWCKRVLNSCEIVLKGCKVVLKCCKIVLKGLR
jgi:hypothetical protein